MPTPETEQLQKELISQRLQVSPVQLGVLMLRKIDVLWSSSGLVWAFHHTQENSNFIVETLYRVIEEFDRALFSWYLRWPAWASEKSGLPMSTSRILCFLPPFAPSFPLRCSLGTHICLSFSRLPLQRLDWISLQIQ
ncbi:MAG: hypothetical protein ACLSHU_03910 [Oscillospiraceae bacterium]